MLTKPGLTAIAIGLTLSAFAIETPTLAGVSVKTGLLNCGIAGGWGYVLGSSRKISCVYTNSDTGRIEHYTGRISKMGLDLGYVSPGTMIWAVLTPTTEEGSGALAGGYAGATVGGALGYGGNVNALIGGEANSISLQPLSMGGNKGLNLAAGLETLSLKYQPLFPNLLK